MYFTKLRLKGLNEVDLPIIGAKPSDPYVCKDVDGLGPTGATVTISNTLEQGGVFQESLPELREIVAMVGLSPRYRLGETSESLREQIYDLFTPGHSEHVKAQLMAGDTVVAETTGYVSKIVPVLFSKEPTVQITIPCTSAYFSAPNLVDAIPSGQTMVEISNPGSARTSFYFELTFSAVTDGWGIASAQDARKKMTFAHKFQTGDTLKVDTRPGSRSIEVVTALGQTVNLIGSLTSDSTWLYMHRGVNSFFTSSAAFVWSKFQFTPQYQGV